MNRTYVLAVLSIAACSEAAQPTQSLSGVPDVEPRNCVAVILLREDETASSDPAELHLSRYSKIIQESIAQGDSDNRWRYRKGDHLYFPSTCKKDDSLNELMAWGFEREDLNLNTHEILSPEEFSEETGMCPEGLCKLDDLNNFDRLETK